MSADYRVEIMRMSLLVRWRSVVYPFEQSQFLRQLPENGYVLAEDIRNRQPSYGGRLEVTGLVATKGELSLLLDAARPGLQLDCTDPVTLIDEFESLEKFLGDALQFRSQDAARFYEFDAQALVNSSASPPEVMKRISSELTITEQVSEIIGENAQAFSLKFTDVERLPGDENWFEMYIEPSLRSPVSTYFTYFIFRRTEREPVIDRSRRINQIFQDLVERIEQR